MWLNILKSKASLEINIIGSILNSFLLMFIRMKYAKKIKKGARWFEFIPQLKIDYPI